MPFLTFSQTRAALPFRGFPGDPSWTVERRFLPLWCAIIAAAHLGCVAIALRGGMVRRIIPLRAPAPTIEVAMIPGIGKSLPAPPALPTPPDATRTSTVQPQPPVAKPRAVAKARATSTTDTRADAQAGQPTPPGTAGAAASAANESVGATAATSNSRDRMPAATVEASPARYDADYLKNPAPAYPALSRRLGEEGRVLLHVFVDAEGHAAQVELKNSSGFARLDQAAEDAVRRWRFVPARHGDDAVGAWVLVPIVFNLKTS